MFQIVWHRGGYTSIKLLFMPETPHCPMSQVCRAIISKKKEGETELDIHIYVVSRRFRSAIIFKTFCKLLLRLKHWLLLFNYNFVIVKGKLWSYAEAGGVNSNSNETWQQLLSKKNLADSSKYISIMIVHLRQSCFHRLCASTEGKKHWYTPPLKNLTRIFGKSTLEKELVNERNWKFGLYFIEVGCFEAVRTLILIVLLSQCS